MYSLIILFHFVYNFLKSSVQNYLSRYDFFFFALDEPLHDLISFNFEIIPFSNGVDCFFSFLLVLYIFLFSCVDCLNWSTGLQHIKSTKFNIIPSFAINNVFFLDVLELGLTNRFIDLITDSFQWWFCLSEIFLRWGLILSTTSWEFLSFFRSWIH